MLKLKLVLQQHGIKQREIAKAADISISALSQVIIHSVWPKKRDKGDKGEIKNAINMALASKGVDKAGVFEEVQAAATARTSAPNHEENEKDETMLLKKQVLFPATKKHDALIAHEDAREALSLAFQLDNGLGKNLLRYIGLFRSESRELTMQRVVKLINELLPDINNQRIERNRQIFSAPP